MGRIRDVWGRRRRQLRDDVARAVVEHRTERGWSQRELALRCGVSRRTIGRIETRQADPRPALLDRLDRALGGAPGRG